MLITTRPPLEHNMLQLVKSTGNFIYFCLYSKVFTPGIRGDWATLSRSKLMQKLQAFFLG